MTGGGASVKGGRESIGFTIVKKLTTKDGEKSDFVALGNDPVRGGDDTKHGENTEE